MPRQAAPKEYCNNPLCQTPKCPYRCTDKTRNEAKDLAGDCSYYSETGDGRWQKAKERFTTKERYELFYYKNLT